MKVLQKITRNGNSSTLTLPAAMLAQLGWVSGNAIVVELTECGTIEIRRPTIADLGAARSPLNLDTIAPTVRT